MRTKTRTLPSFEGALQITLYSFATKQCQTLKLNDDTFEMTFPRAKIKMNLKSRKLDLEFLSGNFDIYQNNIELASIMAVVTSVAILHALVKPEFNEFSRTQLLLLSLQILLKVVFYYFFSDHTDG